MLGVSAAVHVSTGRVLVCEEVLSKKYPLSFLQGTAVLRDDAEIHWHGRQRHSVALHARAQHRGAG
jgi:hypothetical protein